MGCRASKAVAGDIPPNGNFFDAYELAGVLGKGAFGTVHLACNVKSNEKLAVKIMELKVSEAHTILPAARNLPEDVRAEQRALACIGGHPNVVGFRESFVDSMFAYFVIELCTSSLLTAWKNERDLNEYTYVRYFRDMANALAHIHSVRVVHRDVKQDNFMVGAPDGRTVKLCDFGLSAVMLGDDQLSGKFGTAWYMAPEMVTPDTTHGPPADVWSFGVIVYNAFFGCWPYQPEKRTRVEVEKAIREGAVPPRFAPPRTLSQNVVSHVGMGFVKALLDRNQHTRPSAASCLEMPYLDTRRCTQLQVSGKNVDSISLSPELHAARKCGAFTVKPPEADACQELHRMKLRVKAQLRREAYSANPNVTII